MATDTGKPQVSGHPPTSAYPKDGFRRLHTAEATGSRPVSPTGKDLVRGPFGGLSPVLGSACYRSRYLSQGRRSVRRVANTLLPPAPRLLLLPEEVAEHLRTDISHVHDLARSGLPGAVWLDTETVRFNPTGLNAWLASNPAFEPGRTPEPPLTRACRRCERTLPGTAFRRRRRHRDGFDTVCKECHRSHSRFWTDRWNTADVQRRMRSQLRQDRLRANGGTATVTQVQQRFAVWGNACWMCGAPAEHIDHVIAIARGGSGWPANLRPACARCNIRKHTSAGTRRPLLDPARLP